MSRNKMDQLMEGLFGEDYDDLADVTDNETDAILKKSGLNPEELFTKFLDHLEKEYKESVAIHRPNKLIASILKKYGREQK